MKNRHALNLLTTTALLMISTVSFAEDASIGQPNIFANINVPAIASGLEVTLGAVFLQPGADNLGWAATTTVLPIPTPQWDIHTIDPSYQPGFNLAASYFFANTGIDVQLSWTHLRTSDSSNVSVNPASQWVSPFSQTGTPPTGGEITGVASLKKATGKVNFDYDVVNLDAGKFLDLGSILQMRFFSGLSFIYLREELISTFNGLPKASITLDNTSSYTGAGPRLGVSNIFHIYDRLNAVFQLAGSFLVGSMQPAQYEFTGKGSDLAAIGIRENDESLSSSSVTQVVPAADTKIGVNYLFKILQDSSLTLELGWAGAVYINPFSSYETNTNVIALDTGSLSTSSVKHTQSNFSATGPYLTLSMTF